MDKKRPNPIFTNKKDPSQQKSPAGIGKSGLDREEYEKAGLLKKILMWTALVLMSILVAFGLVAYSVITTAIVISFMWEWFIVPLGVPGIGLLHALGLSVLVSYMTNDVGGDKIDKEYTRETSWWVIVFYPWITLAIGWWIHQYM